MDKNFKIFDIILFHGETELLKLRVQEFQGTVEKFIIIPMSDDLIQTLSKIVFTDEVIISETFENATKLYDELLEIMKKHYSTFDDLMFISKENELPNFNQIDKINEELIYRNLYLNHTSFYWNCDYVSRKNEKGSFVTNFSKFLRNNNILKGFWRNQENNVKSNIKRLNNGWKFNNFHSPKENEIFARENLLPDINYDLVNTYKLVDRPINLEIPKNIGILAYNKIGRDYMKKHLFLVESGNSVNLNEINKLYDTVSIIEFSDNVNEVIAENIGESVYKSILHLPTQVLYDEKSLKEFQEDYKKNEIKKIIETVFPQDQDSIRIIYKGFDDIVGLWENFKNQNLSEIINPS
jgi:hypothetical protein